MIIDHFCTFPHGGAGTAARRLHERLVQRGVTSHFRYWKDQAAQRLDASYRQMEWEQGKSPGWIQSKLDKRRVRRICNRYDRHLAKRPENFELFTIPWTLDQSRFEIESLATDILHLHWISFFVDYPSFFASIPGRVPIVWSFHDMNPLTGGCHYSSGCSRFTVGCGSCPQINHPGPRDVSHWAFRDKQRALRDKHIHVVTPNRWLSELAQHSRMFPSQTQYHLIRLGLEQDEFRPIDQTHARNQLGLPPDAALIAFGAEDIENYRKGFHHLLSVLKQINGRRPIECLVFGSGELPKQRQQLPKFHEFGFVDSIQQQALLYSAADVFVLPSREDNQPQTGLEAMACGTPVVAFRAGGIPEYVLHGQTGLLAPVGDEDEMAAQINQLLDNNELRNNLSVAARKLIEQEFTAEKQARSYIELYHQIAGSLDLAQLAPARVGSQAA